MVSAKVLLIPLIYSKVILKGEISTAQLLTLEFRMFWAKISLMADGHFSKLYLHLPNNM